MWPEDDFNNNCDYTPEEAEAILIGGCLTFAVIAVVAIIIGLVVWLI